MLLSFGLALLSLFILYIWSVTTIQELSHGIHCVFAMHVHLVFVTKYRYRVFDGQAVESLRMIFAKVCTDFETTLVEMDGEDNHVHRTAIMRSLSLSCAREAAAMNSNVKAASQRRFMCPSSPQVIPRTLDKPTHLNDMAHCSSRR